MDLAQLQQQLADGKITKEQFAAELKKMFEAGTITQEQHDEAASTDDGGNGGGDGGGGNQAFTDEQMAQIQKMLQSEGDKVRTKAAQEKKDLQDKLDKLETDKMTEEQKAQFEIEKMRKENERTAAELLTEKVGFHTVKTLTAKSLPIEFGEILAGDSIENTDERIGVFEKAWGAAIKAAVDARFKEHGGDPLRDRDRSGSGAKNPWSKENWNMTEQGKILARDKAEANRLAQAAGMPGNY